ncbi:amylo-alpha-1,6-glucosidase [Roseimaritima sediminicola]|uniref:amylo-alpha-1,6-glucosidase n=1 Tax=Roseimaritima sediminicola TaxID=2662066 RepID=UPI0012985549|nr:glycoside hydrolase 100 family protein [Roseimaritima sediminicola]
MNNSTNGSNAASRPLRHEGYRRALQVMHDCLRKDGFLATPTEQDNYRRIWGRDSSIIGVASLLTDDQELIDGCRRSLETLARYQGPHGEIPSNVDPVTERISYGGTAGRVDANLWFIIACGSYWRKTEDDAFLDRILQPLERTRHLLGAWEFNTRGLLYVPPTGDWADEYLQSGYVLYDQLLYLQAQRECCRLHQHVHASADHDLCDRVTRLMHLIRANYWFTDEGTPDDVYHEVLYTKGQQAAPERGGKYWMPFFSPFGYGFRFDGMANALVSLLDVADQEQADCVDEYIGDRIVQEDVMLLPAFDPVITPKDEKWDDLQITFSHTFKNSPYEYHNGGLWPLVTAFYAASLAQRGKPQLARRYADGIHAANRSETDGGHWSFPEFLHGKQHVAGGTHPMGWSAAAAVIAEAALDGKNVFAID